MVGGPVAQIVPGFLAGMEDPDMLVLVAREQALRLCIGSRRVANQHAVLGSDDCADASDRRFRQLEYLARSTYEYHRHGDFPFLSSAPRPAPAALSP